MKLVLKVAPSLASRDEHSLKFAAAVARLSEDGHLIVIIHGGAAEVLCTGSEATGEIDRNGKLTSCPAKLLATRMETLNLLASLTQMRVPVFGLCGSDGGMCRVRKNSEHRDGGGRPLETAGVDTRWPDIMCKNGAVLVVSNLVLSGWGEYCLADPDQMASAWAAAWNANALIYLADCGVKGADGSTVRWLDLEDIKRLETEQAVSGDMLLTLRACREALQRGVPRVRIMPACNADSLDLFFFSKIEYGTEIVVSAR